jgi:hypothetical protein
MKALFLLLLCLKCAWFAEVSQNSKDPVELLDLDSFEVFGGLDIKKWTASLAFSKQKTAEALEQLPNGNEFEAVFGEIKDDHEEEEGEKEEEEEGDVFESLLLSSASSSSASVLAAAEDDDYSSEAENYSKFTNSSRKRPLAKKANRSSKCLRIQSPKIQEARTKLYNDLIKIYNRSRAKAGLESSSRIRWASLEVHGWPAEVKCKAPRGWNFDDIRVLEANLDQISFVDLPSHGSRSFGTKEDRIYLNYALHKELTEKAKLLGLTDGYRDLINWHKIHTRFPQFSISNRDFRNWSKMERENIKRVLLDDLFEKEFDKLKKK